MKRKKVTCKASPKIFHFPPNLPFGYMVTDPENMQIKNVILRVRVRVRLGCVQATILAKGENLKKMSLVTKSASLHLQTKILVTISVLPCFLILP